MRLSGLVFTATVALIAAQVPIVESRQGIQIQQPPRDVVKRAEPTGTARIKGRVVSADRGTPVRRASVSLMTVAPPPSMRGGPPEQGPGAPPTGRSSQPVMPRRATTDSEGQFEFAGLPAGTYRITASPAQVLFAISLDVVRCKQADGDVLGRTRSINRLERRRVVRESRHFLASRRNHHGPRHG